MTYEEAAKQEAEAYERWQTTLAALEAAQFQASVAQEEWAAARQTLLDVRAS